jgi:tetratricopeptide (TPR) repeat protein/DNA-binding SARP family transcriptional activator
MTPGKAVASESLVDRVWGDRQPRNVIHSLYTHISAVRRAVREPDGGAGAATLRRLGSGYLLEIDSDQIDLHRTRRYADEARTISGSGRDQDHRAVELLRAACSQWRGTPLAGLTGDWAAGVRVGLEHEQLALLIERYRVELRLGNHPSTVGELAALLTDHSLVEPLVALNMLALYRSGRQIEALDLYARTRQRLVAEIGDEPGVNLRRLHAKILRRDPELELAPDRAVAVSSGVDGRPGQVRPAQLPPDVAAFTGRSRELEQLDALLPDARAGALVIAAIEGAPGVGKTALALHWARRVRHCFPGGQLFADLRGYAPGVPLMPAEVLARFLSTLGIPREKQPTDVDEAMATYRSLLADQRVLVVLDNAANSGQVRPLLPGGGGSLVLVTSRDWLAGLAARDGAHRVCLDVLSGEESVALLRRLLGARRVRAEQRAVAELARLCDHLPLALRVAAANLGAHPQHRVADHVNQLRQADRVMKMTVHGDEQSAVPAAFDLSYGRLPDPSRRMFRLLGLATGRDISTEAAAALAGLSAQKAGWLLDTLAAAHLVQEHAAGRYGCHELLRAYATDRAQAEETEAARADALARLYDFYLDGTAAAARSAYPSVIRLPEPEPGLVRAYDVEFGDPGEARAWLDAECDNLVAAVRQAGRTLYPRVWRIADNLRGYFWLRVNAAEWLATADAALAAARAIGDHCAEAAGHLSLALLQWRRGTEAAATQHASRALERATTAGWLDGQAVALSTLGSIYQKAGKLSDAASYFHQALQRLEQTGRQASIAGVLGNLTLVYCLTGQLGQAGDYARRAVKMSIDAGSRNGEAVNCLTLGEICRWRGELEEAASQLTRCQELFHVVGNTSGEAIGLGNLAAVHRDAGRYAQAMKAALAAVELARASGEGSAEASCRVVLASVHLQLGQHDHALYQCRSAQEVARQTAARHEEADALICLAAIHRHLEDTERGIEQARQAVALTREAGFRLLEAQALTTLAAAHLASGDIDRAVALGEHALLVHREVGHRLGEARTQVVLGDAARARGLSNTALDHWRLAYAVFVEVGAPEAGDVAALLDYE